MNDFVRDLKTTFPELATHLNRHWKTLDMYAYIDDPIDRQAAFQKGCQKCQRFMYNHCRQKLPPRFFDILYQNVVMFEGEEELDTEFLPKVVFRRLWSSGISDATKETIWKYLQLLLFAVVGDMENADAFQESSSLFEAIDEEELRKKLDEIMQQLGAGSGSSSASSSSSVPPPDAERVHAHLQGLMKGKLGQLAQEIAEETARELNLDPNDPNLTQTFQEMLKQPAKIMGLVKKVSEKFRQKMESGELKQSELLAEAKELMKNGMGSVFSQMAGGGKGGAKMNMSGMENKLNQQIRLEKQKERLRAKAAKKRGDPVS